MLYSCFCYIPTDFSFDLEVKVKSESKEQRLTFDLHPPPHSHSQSSVKTDHNKGIVNVNVKTDQKTSEGICLRSLAVEMCRNYIIAQEQRENVSKTPTAVLADTYKHS